MSETPTKSRSDTPATTDSGRGKVYIDTPPGSNPNTTSLCSQRYFTDELLLALEKAGKSLLEIIGLILPFNEVDPPAIVVDGYEASSISISTVSSLIMSWQFYNDDDPSNMTQKKVRIRELLEASFEETTRLKTRLEEADEAKKVLKKELERVDNQRQLLVKEKLTAGARFRLLALTAKNRFGVTRSKDGLNARKRQREAEAISSAINSALTEELGETERSKRARLSENSDMHRKTTVYKPEKEQKIKKENNQPKIKKEPGLESSSLAASWDAREKILSSNGTGNVVSARARLYATEESQTMSNRSTEPFTTPQSATLPASKSTQLLELESCAGPDSNALAADNSFKSTTSNTMEEETTSLNSPKTCLTTTIKGGVQKVVHQTTVPVINAKKIPFSDTIMADRHMDSERSSYDYFSEALSARQPPPKDACTSVKEVNTELQANREITATLSQLAKPVTPSGALIEIPTENRKHNDTSSPNMGFVDADRVDDVATTDDSVESEVCHPPILTISNGPAPVSSWSKRILSADLDDDDKSSEEAEFTDGSDTTATTDGMSRNSNSDVSLTEHGAAARTAESLDEEDDADDEYEDANEDGGRVGDNHDNRDGDGGVDEDEHQQEDEDEWVDESEV